MSTAGGHRTGFTRFPADRRGMPEDHFARAAHPCRGQFPSSAAGEQLRGSSRTRQGVACDHAEPRIHCRGTHRQEWPTPIHLAVRHAIADVRHVRNGTGRYCTLRGNGQAHLPAASGNHDVKPGQLYSRRPHRLHHPALRPCEIPRRVHEVHVTHTGESDAGRADSFWLLGEAIAELPDLKVHGQFTDRTRSKHKDRQHRR